jgi:hypothetical protein
MFLTLVGLAVAVFVFLVMKKPDNFRYERSVIINAPAAMIFPHVNGTKAWLAWSPWVKMDPDAKMAFSGPDTGVGASTSWVGKKTGEGSSTVVESKPSELIKFRLDFLKPMKATNIAEFTFAQQASGTLVTWSMYGKNTLFSKFFSVFVNCQKMVEKQFQQGLNDLKTLVEGEKK